MRGETAGNDARTSEDYPGHCCDAGQRLGSRASSYNSEGRESMLAARGLLANEGPWLGAEPSLPEP